MGCQGAWWCVVEGGSWLVEKLAGAVHTTDYGRRSVGLATAMSFDAAECLCCEEAGLEDIIDRREIAEMYKYVLDL